MSKTMPKNALSRTAIAALLCAIVVMLILWIVSYWYRMGLLVEMDGRIWALETWSGRVQLTRGNGVMPNDRRWAVYRVPRFAPPVLRTYYLNAMPFWTWWWLPMIICGCAVYWLMAQRHPSLYVLLGEAARRRQRREQGRCERCGYDLRGSEDRCPECGEPRMSID